jgi:hypothetical protein
MTNTYANRLRTGLSLQQPTGLWTNGFAYDAAFVCFCKAFRPYTTGSQPFS